MHQVIIRQIVVQRVVVQQIVVQQSYSSLRDWESVNFGSRDLLNWALHVTARFCLTDPVRDNELDKMTG